MAAQTSAAARLIFCLRSNMARSLPDAATPAASDEIAPASRSSDPRGGGTHGAPGGAPATLDAGQTSQRNHRERREQQEARLVATRTLLGYAQAGSEIEATDAAGHPDES